MMTFDFQFSNFCAKLRGLFGRVSDTLRSVKRQMDDTRKKASRQMEVRWGRVGRTSLVAGKKRVPSLAGIEISTTVAEKRGAARVSWTVDIGDIDVVHQDLCNVVLRLQNAYQTQISLNLAVCFFNTVCVLFITISEYRANTDWMLWISGLLWVTYYVLRVIMVCTSAGQVIYQACEPKKYLSCMDDEYVNERRAYQIEKFLLRITHTNIRFTLCDLLTVNTSLLSSAGLGVITYLVIALQYSYT